MRILPAVALLLTTALKIHALHFYLDSDEERCFIEELPTDTIVEGMFISAYPLPYCISMLTAY
jgi:hypothetical protein